MAEATFRVSISGPYSSTVRLKVMKAVKDLTGVRLQAAKEIVDGDGEVAAEIPFSVAKRYESVLIRAGANVELVKVGSVPSAPPIEGQALTLNVQFDGNGPVFLMLKGHGRFVAVELDRTFVESAGPAQLFFREEDLPESDNSEPILTIEAKGPDGLPLNGILEGDALLSLPSLGGLGAKGFLTSHKELTVNLRLDEPEAEIVGVLVEQHKTPRGLLYQCKMLEGQLEGERLVDVYSEEQRLLFSAEIVTSGGQVITVDDDPQTTMLINREPAEPVLELPPATEWFIVGRGQELPPVIIRERIVEVEPPQEPEEFVEPDLKGRDNSLWQRDQNKRFGLVLQGGGVRGSFQFGAMYVLNRQDIVRSLSDIDMIGCASTGSLTAVTLMSRALTRDAVSLGLDQYEQLDGSSAMLTLKPEVVSAKAEAQIVQTALDSLLDGGEASYNYQEALTSQLFADVDAVSLTAGISTGAGLAWILGPFGSFLGAIIGGITVFVSSASSQSGKIADAVEQLLGTTGSVASIEPVRRLLSQSADFTELRRGTTKLRMAVTNLPDGVTAYFDEAGQLHHPEQGHPTEPWIFRSRKTFGVESVGNFTGTAGAPQESDSMFKSRMIESALTSCSFPGIYDPVQIVRVDPDSGDRLTDFYSDGGIRENLPIEPLVDEGIEQIVAIYSDPLCTQRDESYDAELPKWPGVAGRAVQLITNEITRTDASFGESLSFSNSLHSGKGPEVLHIAPGIPTLGLTEVDPVLNRIMFVYGGMRAFDEMHIAKMGSQSNNLLKLSLRDTSDRFFAAARSEYFAFIEMIRHGLYEMGDEEQSVSSSAAQDKPGEIKKAFLDLGGYQKFLLARREMLLAITTRESLFQNLKVSSKGSLEISVEGVGLTPDWPLAFGGELPARTRLFIRSRYDVLPISEFVFHRGTNHFPGWAGISNMFAMKLLRKLRNRSISSQTGLLDHRGVELLPKSEERAIVREIEQLSADSKVLIDRSL